MMIWNNPINATVMKSLNFLRILVILIGFWAINSNAQECYWSSHAGGNAPEGASVIGADKNGNVYITGGTESQYCFFNTDTLHLGAWNQSFFVKYDAEGNEVWIKPFSGPSESFKDGYISVGGITDTIRNVILGYGHFYNLLSLGDTILYGSGQTVFVMKMDLDGNVIWARTGGGLGRDFAFGITYDEIGNIYISGSNENEATFGSTSIPPGGFLAKYGTDGDLVWVKNKFRNFNLYPSNPDFPFTEAPPFNILYSNRKLLINGNISNDTIIIDTITIIKTSGYVSSYLASFDTSGNIEWIRRAGGPEGRCGGQFTVDSSGDIFITGMFTKTGIFGNDTLTNTVAFYDCFLAKYTSDGGLIWAKQLNSNSSAQGRGVSSNGNGDIYLAGFFDGKACFGSDTLISGSWSDMFLARYSSEGNCQGVRQYSFGMINDFTIDQAGNIFLAGNFQNSLTIGPNTFTSYGDDDVFVAKCGEITGIGEQKPLPANQLVIYANPNEGKCNITIPDDFRNEKNLLLQIFDIHGKVIQKIPIEVTDDKISVNISEEAKGIYNAILSNGKKNYSGKIVFN
jgi:hypothetical protein